MTKFVILFVIFMIIIACIAIVLVEFYGNKDNTAKKSNPYENIQKVKILKLIPQNYGVMVVFEFLLDRNRSSVNIGCREVVPMEGEVWEVKLDPIYNSKYVFYRKISDHEGEIR